MSFVGNKHTSQATYRVRITPELVRAITERVYALLLRERELEAERGRTASIPAPRRGGRY